MLRSLKNSKGFTLIELVMVIVILGVLAAVAVPKFTDLQHRAYLSSEQGIVGGVRSGIAVFAASAIAGGTIDTAGSAATINGYGIPSTLDSAGATGAASDANPLFDLILGQGAVRADWSKTDNETYEFYPGGNTSYWTDRSESAHTWYYNGTTSGDGRFVATKDW